MAKFWIDFSTSVQIEAKTAEEAEELFWDNYDTFDDSGVVSAYGPIGIDGIEEEED